MTAWRWGDVSEENDRLAVLSAPPFAMMAAVTVVDVATGPAVGLLPLVSLGPAFAPLVGGWRRTLGVGVIALLLTVGLSVYNDLFDAARGYVSTASVIGVTAAGLVAVSAHQDREPSHMNREDQGFRRLKMKRGPAPPPGPPGTGQGGFKFPVGASCR